MALLSKKIKTPEQRLAWEILFLIPVLVMTGLFGHGAEKTAILTTVMTIIFLVNLIARFICLNAKGDWLFFTFGVIGGGGNDMMSMIRGVYNYKSITIVPFLNGLMPLWSILFWGQVILLFRKIFNVPIFKGEGFKKEGFLFKGWISKKLLLDLAILIILRVIIYNTYSLDWWIPALLYFIVILVRFIVYRPKRNELYIMIILPYAFIFEGLMVSFGLYEYYNPVFLGMPAWLYLWWVFLVPIFVKEIFDMLEFYMEKKDK
ncbi:MAG: hypothetical protein ACTSWN_12100 [Promethearchaeota archaeon]